MSLEAVVFRRMDPKLKLAILVIGFLVLIAFPIANSYFLRRPAHLVALRPAAMMPPREIRVTNEGDGARSSHSKR